MTVIITMRRQTVKSYRVIAIFTYPPIDRSAVIQAESIDLAILRAVLEQKIPVEYRRDRHGNLQPAYWTPEMGGHTRWPRIEQQSKVVWGSKDQPRVLRVEVVEEQ